MDGQTHILLSQSCFERISKCYLLLKEVDRCVRENWDEMDSLNEEKVYLTQPYFILLNSKRAQFALMLLLHCL